MIEVKRKPNETISSFLRRFSRRVMQSGLIMRARKRAFYVKPKSREEKRTSAIYRAKMAKELEKKQKMGKPVKYPFKY